MELECPKCTHQYGNDGAGAPFVIQRCGHVVCNTCLDELPTSSGDGEFKRKECPVCGVEFLYAYDAHNLKVVAYTQLKEHKGLDVIGRGQFKLAENVEFTPFDRGWNIRRLELHGSGTVRLGMIGPNCMEVNSRRFRFTVPREESFLSTSSRIDTIRCTLERTRPEDGDYMDFGIFRVCNIFNEIVILGDINLYIYRCNDSIDPNRIHIRHPDAKVYMKDDTDYFTRIKT